MYLEKLFRTRAPVTSRRVLVSTMVDWEVAWIHVYIPIYIYIHTHTYIHMYTDTHTYAADVPIFICINI